MSGIQAQSISVSRTVRTFLRRLGTSAYTSGAISLTDLPSNHLSSQKREDSPLPSTIEVEAAKTSSSAFENCMSSPRQGRKGLVCILQIQHTRSLIAVCEVRDTEASETQRAANPRPANMAVASIGLRPAGP